VRISKLEAAIMLDFLPLFLNSRSSAQNIVDPDDVVAAKQSLQALGYYEPWDGGINAFTDNALFNGIRAFQEDHELTVDGYMDPGGETATEIGKQLDILLSEEEEAVQVAASDSDPREPPGDHDSKPACEGLLNRDMSSCRAVGNRRGKQAYERCRKTAMDRYGHCRAGRSLDTLPPLDIYVWPGGRRRR
jgi:hypothetical protein